MPPVRLALVPRATLRDWQRQRLTDIFVECAVLRADLARLQRLSTRMARCDRCRHGATVTIQDTGFWYCRRCQLATQEAHA